MAGELAGVIVNPKPKKRRRRKKRVKRNPAKGRIRAVTRGRGKTTLIIANPARDTSALLQLAAGTAAGLAGGKLISRFLFNHAPQVASLNQTLGVDVGDVAVLAGGLFALKKNTRHKEFATGVVAGAGAKIALNLLDKFLFKNSGTVSLHGEEDYYVAEDGSVHDTEEEPEEVGRIDELSGSLIDTIN